MPILGLFSFFERHEPQTVYLQGLGDFTSERNGFWNGKPMFRPLGRELDLAIKSPPEPPGMEAVNFFRQIEGRWLELWSAMRKTLFAELDDFPDGTTMEQFFDSMRVDALEFWSLEQGRESWEITCTTPLDGHVFGIEMLGWDDQGFRMDG